MKFRWGTDISKMSGTQFWKGPHLSRRLLFRHAAAGVGGYFLMPVRPMETIAKGAGSPVGTARNCIFIYMQGGPSHIDTFDLKEGPWLPASYNPTRYGDVLWPQGLMPKLAEQLDNIVLLRSVRAWALVHGISTVWLQIARNPLSGLARIAPHIGSVVSLELGPRSDDRTLPAFLALNSTMGPGNGYFAPEHAPFYVSPGGGGLGNTQHRDGAAAFERRYGLLIDLDAELRESGELGGGPAEMAQFNLSARKLMYNPAVDRIFTFDQNERNRYGNTGFGNACITARNLLRANMGTRFIQIQVGSWDMHNSIYTGGLNAGNVNSLGRQFDSALGTLIGDLKNDGLLDETLIFAMGEFGRTIGNVNVTAGRDHFLQQAVLFAGARIRGRRAIGATDGEGRATTEPGWSENRDVRAEDVAATVYSALGIDWTTTRRDDPLGRGFEYVPFAGRGDYAPVHELWG